MKRTKYVHVGEYVAEVDVELVETSADEWGPYLSLQDAYRLDDVRQLLKIGNIAEAAKHARVFTLTPVATDA